MNPETKSTEPTTYRCMKCGLPCEVTLRVTQGEYPITIKESLCCRKPATVIPPIRPAKPTA